MCYINSGLFKWINILFKRSYLIFYVGDYSIEKKGDFVDEFYSSIIIHSPEIIFSSEPSSNSTINAP